MKIKTIIISVAVCCFTLSISAQKLLSKIPSNASVVATIKGKNIVRLLSIEEFSNSTLGKMLNKEIAKESHDKVMGLSDLGLDYDNDFHYFMEVNNGVFSHCFLIPLDNPQGFLNTMSSRQRDKIIAEGDFGYIQDKYDGSTIIWNKNTLVIVTAKDNRINDYYSYNYEDLEEVESVVEETVIESDEIEETVIESDEIEETVIESLEIEETVIESVEIEETVIESVEIEETVIGSVEIEETVIGSDEIEETVIGSDEIEETVIEMAKDDVPYYESESYQKEKALKEKRREEKEEKRKLAKETLHKNILKKAKQILIGNLASNSILTNADYIKNVANKNEEASIWVKNFASIYKESIPNYMLSTLYNPYKYMDIDALYNEISVVASLDFEKDQAIINTKYTMNDKMASWYKPIYNTKINKNFAKYINEDHLLGYMTLNTSTEGILNAYPNMVSDLLIKGSEETLSESVALGVKMFSMLVDEQEVAKIIKGDMLLVLTDLAEREVTYTDYDYDEEFNYTKTEKTKTETIPDFMFMFTSEEQEIYNRIIKIGVNEKELIPLNGVYEIKEMPSASPFKIYITYKDNLVIVGSSLKNLQAIKNGSFISNISSHNKKNITKNASSIYVNGKKIISQIPVSSFPKELREKVDFLTNNTEDISFNMEKLKGNSIKGQFIWKTSEENHKNSFSYFINMINGLMKDH